MLRNRSCRSSNAAASCSSRVTRVLYRGAQRRPPLRGASVVGAARIDSLAEIAHLVLDAAHVGGERRGAFGQRGVFGLDIGDLPAAGVHPLPRLGQPHLGPGETLPGRGLFRREAADRRTGLLLLRSQPVALLHRCPSIRGDDALPLQQAGACSAHLPQVRVQPDERLLVLVGGRPEPFERLRRTGCLGLQPRDLVVQARDSLVLRDDASPKLLDLPLGCEEPSCGRPPAPRHERLAAEHAAVGGRDRVGRNPGRGPGLRERRGEPSPIDRRPHRLRRRTADAHRVRNRPQALVRRRRRGPRAGGRCDEETATAGVVLRREHDAGGCVLVRHDHHVLQQIRQAGFHGTLVRPLDLQVVGDRSLVGHPRREHDARRVGVRCSAGLELLQRLGLGAQGGRLAFALAHRARRLRRPGPRRSRVGLPARHVRSHALERRSRLAGGLLGAAGCVVAPRELGGDVGRLHLEPGERVADAVLPRVRVGDDVLQGRHRRDRRVDLAPRGFHLRRETLNGTLGLRGARHRAVQAFRRGVSLRAASLEGAPLARELRLQRAAPALERRHLRLAGRDRLGQRRHLLPVELDALPAAVEIELALVDLVARRAGLPIGLRQGGPEPGFGTLQVHQPGRGRPFARPRLGEPAIGVHDRSSERHAAPREVDLLPASQLLAQAAVAPRPGRLPLERPALLLDLEDDVVDAGQVLLRRLELELGRPPPRLVLGDAGRLLEQLPALGRARPQYLTDAPLLDHRVGLHAHARVHQEVLHVAQSADLPVDEVLALPGAVQAPPHLDVAPDERGIDIAVVRLGSGRLRRGHPRRRNGPRLRRRAADGTAVRARGVVPLPPPAPSTVSRPWPLPAPLPSPNLPASPRAGVAGGTGPARAARAAATSDSRSRTSAAAVGRRASLPPKITSSIRSPRRLRALCSPRTHVMASMTLLLPQPFGPTMAVTPPSNASSARSGKLLKPAISR